MSWAVIDYTYIRYKEIRLKERRVIWLWLSIHVLDERRRG